MQYSYRKCKSIFLYYNLLPKRFHYLVKAFKNKFKKFVNLVTFLLNFDRYLLVNVHAYAK